MQLLLPLAPLPVWPKPKPETRNWFPRIKCEIEQYDILEPRGPATHEDLLAYEKYIWDVAYGDSMQDWEDSFGKLREHLLRKVHLYRKRPGHGFASWVVAVCNNWKASELRKKRLVTSPLVPECERMAAPDDTRRRELEIVFEGMSEDFVLVMRQMVGEIGMRERDAALREMGYRQCELRFLTEWFREWARDQLSFVRS